MVNPNMPSAVRRFVLLLLIAALLTACATSPTGRRQLMLVSEDSAIASSAQAYVQEVGKLKQEGKLSDDRALIKRVNDISGRLVAQAVEMRPDSADWKWSVAVIDDPETVNAWCMAGGRMAIYTGLIEQIEPSDDEIAQVMGHEIGHALANHTAEKMSVAMASSIGVLAVGIAADNKGAAMAGATAAAALAVTMPNSRAAETEADRIGIELAAKAGYDPDAAVTLWRKMNALPGGQPPQFLSTHPNPANREKALAALGPEMEPYYRADTARPSRPVQTVTAFN
jgi:predicted Zn-dependent protease